MKKKMIQVTVTEDIGWSLEGPLNEAINYLQTFPSVCSNFSNFRIITDWDYDDRKILGIVAERLETDKELKKREQSKLRAKKAAKEMKEKKAIKERKEYERLKKKYESTTK